MRVCNEGEGERFRWRDGEVGGDEDGGDDDDGGDDALHRMAT